MSYRRFLWITSILFAVYCAPVRAGAEGMPEVELRGGLTIAKLRNLNDPYNVFEALKGFTGGIAVAWPVGKFIAVQPELLYVVKGVSFGESEGTDPGGNPLGTFELLRVNNVVEVPVLLRFVIPTGGPVRPVVLAGPFMSFEVSEQRKTTGSLKSSANDQILNNTDFGAVLGIGAEVSAGPLQWLFDARYDLGLADLGEFYGSRSVYSGAFLFTTGVRLVRPAVYE